MDLNESISFKKILLSYAPLQADSIQNNKLSQILIKKLQNKLIAQAFPPWLYLIP